MIYQLITYWKCFRFCPCMKMWKLSNARGLRMALIPCICLGARTLAVFYPTLYRCGVLRRLFLHRSFHNLHTDKRDRLHTFCLFTPTILELVVIINFYIYAFYNKRWVYCAWCLYSWGYCRDRLCRLNTWGYRGGAPRNRLVIDITDNTFFFANQ